jgi:hypothetical protein
MLNLLCSIDYNETEGRHHLNGRRPSGGRLERHHYECSPMESAKATIGSQAMNPDETTKEGLRIEVPNREAAGSLPGGILSRRCR